MQVGFITNLRKILEKGEDRALLISATGTGKTYASAFAMRELGFKRVLFLVHRGQLARQTKNHTKRFLINQFLWDLSVLGTVIMTGIMFLQRYRP